MTLTLRFGHGLPTSGAPECLTLAKVHLIMAESVKVNYGSADQSADYRYSLSNVGRMWAPGK
jgi:hypothetical protein